MSSLYITVIQNMSISNLTCCRNNIGNVFKRIRNSFLGLRSAATNRTVV